MRLGAWLIILLIAPLSAIAQNEVDASCPVSGTYKERLAYHEMFLKGTKVMVDSSEGKAKSTIDAYSTLLKESGWSAQDTEKLTTSIMQTPEWTNSDQAKTSLLTRYANLLAAIHTEPEVSPEETCKNIDESWQTLFQIATESMQQYALLIKGLKTEYESRQERRAQ